MKAIIEKGGNYYQEYKSNILPGDVLEVHNEEGDVVMNVVAVNDQSGACRGCCLDIQKGCYGMQCKKKRLCIQTFKRPNGGHMRKFYASAIRSKVINSSPKPALGDTVTLDIDGTTHVALVAQDHDLSCAGCLLYNRDPAIICPVDIEGLLLCGKIHAIFKPLDNLMEDI